MSLRLFDTRDGPGQGSARGRWPLLEHPGQHDDDAFGRSSFALTMTGALEPGAPVADLDWAPPGLAAWQPIPPQTLFVTPAGGLGLQLRLTPGLDPSSQPMDEYVDPVLSHYYHVSPFSHLHLDPPIWTADWAGQLDAPESGTYGFALDHSQAAGVWIDDHYILGNLNGLADAHTTNLELTGGRHAIRVRYEKTEDGSPWINLSWTPPGAPPSIVPGSALFGPPPVVVGLVP